jgi:O-antigen/teichoic acid export membrane protein
MILASSAQQFARRAGLIGVDQALSSAGNFALTVVVARQSTPTEFAQFGVAIGIYFVVLALVRALASDPYVILSAGADPQERRLMGGWSVSGAILVGVVSSVAILAAALVWSNGRDYLIPIVVCLPALALHEHLRQLLIAQRRVSIPLAADAVWLVGFFVLVTWFHPFSTAAMPVWIWAGTGVAAALVSVAASRIAPRIAQLGRWGIDIRRVGSSYSIQLLAGAVWWQIVALVAVVFMDTERAAGVRGAGVLLAVGSLASTVWVTAAFPSIAQSAKPETSRMWQIVGAVVVAVVTSVVAIALLLLLVPDSYGRSLLGDSWLAAQAELLFATSTFVTMGVVSVVAVAMRALERLVAGAVMMVGATFVILVATVATASATPKAAGVSTTLVGLAVIAAVGSYVVRVINQPSTVK